MRKIEFLDKEKNDLIGDRGLWDQDLQDIIRFIRPGSSDFLRELTRGESRHSEIYDGTAIWALEQFAAGIHSFNTSPTERWFGLNIDDRELAEDQEVKQWLESVSDLIFKEYGKPNVGFNQAMHENYLDLGSLGTSILYQHYDSDKDHLVFRAFPLAQCYVKENFLGHVDTLYRKMTMTVRQVSQQFPDAHKFEKMQQKRPNDKLEIIHAVFPSGDNKTGVDGISKHKTNRPFVSYWFCKELDDGSSEDGAILLQDGYEEFPYHVPRWTKLAGEIYGRSPGRTALHDVRMLNNMARTIIQKAEQVVNPSVEIEDDSVIGDIATGAGSIIWKEPGSAPIRAIDSGARLDVGTDVLNMFREQVLKAFHVDWLLRQRKNERQTAFEVSDERDEKLRMMSPMLGRLQVELYGPMIQRTYLLLGRRGQLPEAPASLGDTADIEVYYTSPAARAQNASKSTQVRMYIERSLGMIAQLNQDAIDVIDTDQAAIEMAKWDGVPLSVIRTDEQIMEVRTAKAENQANQQAVENAPLEASSIKDIATARSLTAQSEV
jgi:hypothetical protein